MRGTAITRLLVVGCIAIPWMCASDLERGFAQTVRPFLTSYCVGCHGGHTPAAQFDLRSYATTAAVIRDLAHWNLVLEKLTAQEMPPKHARGTGCRRFELNLVVSAQLTWRLACTD
jgi:hypothetical protein